MRYSFGAFQFVVKIDMVDCAKDMLKLHSKPVHGSAVTLASEKLFQVDDKSPLLGQKLKEEFHTMVAKGLFLSKRARPDIQPTIAFLCTRVNAPAMQDWTKPHRLMSFLKQMQDECLTLKMDDDLKVEWHVDAAFAVHPNMRGHTGVVMTMGKGAFISMSCKQKCHAHSSTEAELIGIDNAMSRIIWTMKFLEAQDFKVNDCVVYQDNKSEISLEKNGRLTAGKRTRHLDIKLFYVVDHVEKGLLRIECCPTDLMIADYGSKPLVGKKFKCFRGRIMNLKPNAESASG